MNSHTPDGRFIPFPSFEKWCQFRAGMHTRREEYEAQKSLAARLVRYTHCEYCKQPFTDSNVRTEDGWRETHISGSCEDCFDEMFGGEEDGRELGEEVP